MFYSCLIFLALLRGSSSDKSRETLYLSAPIGDKQNITVNGWLNVTFQMITMNCANQTLMVTVESLENQIPAIHCKIFQNKMSCTVTDTSGSTNSCCCQTPEGPVEFFKKMERPGDVVFRWRWQAVSSEEDNEKKITVSVIATENEKRHRNDNTLKYVTADTGGFLVVVVLVVIFIRCLKLSASACNTNNRQQNKADLPFATEDVYSTLCTNKKSDLLDIRRVH